ncbi:protein SLC31A2 isoform X4 [Procambarus clarkii]|uniref:protein SLC31A2 isoform X4 n=1 Tax=Procambarus clarkii TaxID=6728 RepID=UPI001E6721FD|nr:high affinity copper uptake protein 1-like isoform X5 [Procambarus clarkii]
MLKMHMSYYFSSTVCDFLFKGVNIITTWGMVSLCLGLLSLSVLAEGFKVARSQLLKVAASRKTGCNKYEIPERSPLLMSESFLGRRNQKFLYKRRVKFHILQSFLHVVHLTIGYILMLVVMTYNAYFTIAVVSGAGLGYFFFAVFDLPSKVLGTYHSNVTKASTNSTCGPEGEPLQVVGTTNEGGATTMLRSYLMCSKDEIEKKKIEDRRYRDNGKCEDCHQVEHTTLSLVKTQDIHNPV